MSNLGKRLVIPTDSDDLDRLFHGKSTALEICVVCRGYYDAIKDQSPSFKFWNMQRSHRSIYWASIK